MTVEVSSRETQMDEPVVAQDEPVKVVAGDTELTEPNPKLVEKSSSYREESNFLSDLKESERKALNELKSKLEEAILGSSLFKKNEEKKKKSEKEKRVSEEKENETKEEPLPEGDNGKEKEGEQEEKSEVGVEGKGDEEKKSEEGAEGEDGEEKKSEVGVEGKSDKEKKSDVGSEGKGDEEKKSEEGAEGKDGEEKKSEVGVEGKGDEENKSDVGSEGKGDEENKSDVGVEEKGEEKKKSEEAVEEKFDFVDKDISIWGVPLLPSKAAEGLDVVLLKFLRAREFKVNDAYQMLEKTVQWRKDFNVDSILDEEFPAELNSAGYMNGTDRRGHPVCYNVYGVFANEELYQKTFGTEEKREQFLRWRYQLMEKGIQKLDLKPGGVTSILQINDLMNCPGLTKKELRGATKQAVGLLQDNYPELVAKNIFINTPFWIYALNALLSPFLTQRSKSKFVFARPSKVTETLSKYIPVEQIPLHYGGFKRENDTDFSGEDVAAAELVIKGGSTATIDIPAEEVGDTLVWDVTVLGWDISYKEEFVPTDEGSYTIIVRKNKKMTSVQEAIRNSFRNNEPGKIIITIENGSSKRKKVLYRYKIKKNSSF